jgi:dihydrofolate reductase
MTSIAFMVAASENNVIGAKGKIPWKLKGDLDFMREVTKGCPLIMGRKTHESIGRPLPGRRNIVVTSQDVTYPGCDVVRSVEEGIELAKKDDPREIFIFGGGEIYKAGLPYANRIYLTRVHTQVEGDAFFPEVNWSEWKEVRNEPHEADADNDHAYTILVYERER